MVLSKDTVNSEYLALRLYLNSTGMPEGTPLIVYKFNIVGPRGNVLYQKGLTKGLVTTEENLTGQIWNKQLSIFNNMLAK